MSTAAADIRSALRRAAAWLPAAAALPAVARLAALRFVDQRYQLLMQPESPPAWAWIFAAALLGAATWSGLMAFRRRSVPDSPETSLLMALLPLLPLAVFWRLPLSYGGVICCVFLFAWAAGRFFSLAAPDAARTTVRRGGVWLTLTVLLYAVWGAYLQYRSYSRLGMQWLDWGHYYEALLNTWRGRFFHLNIGHGCFLGSRFCPSLLILSPVLLTGVRGFFFTGSLLVASGAFPVYLLARKFQANAAEALLFGLWYLLLPGVVNLNMPLLDGFHEVFMLIPAALWALWAYVSGRYAAAWLLVLFCFGVRETAPFMFLGFGVTLFLLGRRRHGVLLAVASAAALVLILGVLMPLARPAGSVYDHVVFYPHLGGSIPEIALSPVLRPTAFWSAVGSPHAWRYYGALFLPFLFLAPSAPAWLIPMLFDLLMVAADRRFDSQTLLRHYQCAMLITLVAAALAGFRKVRSGRAPRLAGWFLAGLPGARLDAGVLASTLAAAFGMTLFFTQIPGLPGSDPRLAGWSDARELVREFAAHMEPGAEVTAGPRLASFLVGRYETFFDYDDPAGLRRYVLIESFVPTYNEHRFRRKLLRSDEWTLLKSEYLDERLIQLFERRKRKTPPPEPVVRLSETEWSACGGVIPSAIPELEMRGRVERGHLVVSARLVSRVAFDIGFSLRLGFRDAPGAVFFDSFGHGVYPADFAAPGEVYRFGVPLSGTLENCTVDLVKIP